MGKALRLRPEEDTQIAVVDYIRKCCPTVILCASMNGVYFGSGKGYVYAKKLKKLGMLVGEPDLRLHWRNQAGPQTLYLELKSLTGQISENQASVMVDLTKLGFPCEIVRSIEDLKKVLKLHGVPCLDRSI